MKSLTLLSGLLIVASMVGCAATTVQVPIHQAPAVDVTGIRTIAVVDFEGPAPHAQTARHAVATALQDRCDVPDPATVRKYLPASVPYSGYGIDVPRLITQARQAGFDAVLIGKVDCGSENAESVRLGNPTLTVEIETQLVDVRSGNVRGQASGKKSYTGKVSSLEKAKNSQQKIMQGLTLGATQQVVNQLDGQTLNIDVELATAESGDDEKRFEQGLAAAERGDWTTASEQFRQAAMANPGSSAALFNLGVAYEALADLQAARASYLQALAHRENGEYRNALARVDNHLQQREPARRR